MAKGLNPSPKKQRRKAQAVLDKKPVQGWNTSDEDELAIRRWRGVTEVLEAVALDPERGFFGDFRVRSASGGAYDVEIRDLAKTANSCGCIDHRTNRLGTCKHIEGALAAIERGKKRAFHAAALTGSPRAEVFLDRRDEASPRLRLSAETPEAVREWLQPWIVETGALVDDPAAIESLIAAFAEAPDEVRAHLRVSRHFGPWIARARRARARLEAAAAFETDVAAGLATFDMLKFPLLPYQRGGAMHLAFGERALLADEMGLGKTIQAIGACELLARRKDISRVLVVCPASLKGEWDEQIAKFCDRSRKVVFGPRAERLAAYEAPAFFTIVNYEQVASDVEDINARLQPEIVVLDESQRIKNWRTKTARQVKNLKSPYAFVLTGTPLENRIDDLYSIVQYLDPELLGPLFRFNRDFYELDDRGRPINYKNLSDLSARVASVMLRRRKRDVENELPGRTVKNYFIAMAPEQAARYGDYAQQAMRLIVIAQRRPLRQEEFDRLQQYLACMRMVCDTPAILDPECRICPKLEELEGILGDLLEDPERKIIVFSEWERMLQLVRELSREMGVEAAWHTGSVPQDRRRAEIHRFKNDPACRLFLSTDSGATGLNLQVASAVINVDLPWNPARYEQRIARAWRKNQTRSVAVINLVAEGTIEHNILHLLGQKQALADGVLDGTGDLSAIEMPNGRAALIERMSAMMAEKAPAAPRLISAAEAFLETLLEKFPDRVLLVEESPLLDGRAKLMVVVADPAARSFALAGAPGVVVEALDLETWRAMQRLVASGLLRFSEERVELHRSPELPRESAETEAPDRARAAVVEAERAMRMAEALAKGGCPEEAPPLLVKALRATARALLAARGEPTPETPADSDLRRLVEAGALPSEALNLIEAARAPSADVAPLFAAANRVLSAVRRNEPRMMAAE
jgi:hypothetical protein